MVTMKASILISSFNRLPLLRRTLWAISRRQPNIPFEVVIADESSTDDILGELRLFSAAFRWKFVRVDIAKFEQATGIKKFWNNCSLTNNIAFRHCDGDFIFLQGNDIIALDHCYDELIAEVHPAIAATGSPNFLLMSSTFDLRTEYLNQLDQYGSNLTPALIEHAKPWPLQSPDYRSDVTNYVSLCSRSLWETIGGYDERYVGGICAEDSDFVRRARALPGFHSHVSERAVSLHQCHKGKTRYYNPSPKTITMDKFEAGCAINRAIYHQWDGQAKNPQPWTWGELGVVEVISNA